MLGEDVTPKKKLEDIMHLAELCIEVLQQNEEHHAEVSTSILPAPPSLPPTPTHPLCVAVALSHIYHSSRTPLAPSPLHLHAAVRC